MMLLPDLDRHQRIAGGRTGVRVVACCAAAGLALVLGLLATAVATWAVASSGAAETAARVEAAADRVAAQIQTRLSAEVAALTVLRNDLVHEWPVTRVRFHEVVQASRDDGVFASASGVEIIRRIDGADLAGFVERTAADPSLEALGYPPLEVEDLGGADALVIDYIVPIEGNEPAFGLNLASVEGRLDVVTRARDSGSATASPPIELRQGGRALLLDVPLYDAGEVPATAADRRSSFVGVLTALVRLDDLVGEILAGEPAAALGLVDVADGTDLSLLLDERIDLSHPDLTRAEVDVADRTWAVLAHPSPDVAAAGPSPGLVATVGVLVSLALAVSAGTIERARGQARAAAREADEARADLADLNADLECRIEARTAELARTNADLEQFAYAASHDLQEPLRQVSLFVGRLAERYDEVLDERGRTYMDFVTGGTARMRRLIEALLAYSRVGQRTPRVQRVVLADVLTEVRAGMAAMVEEAGATISWPEGVVLQADRVLVSLVLQNLLDNAVRYGATTVTVRAHLRDETWRIAVADDGQGIPQEHHERAFDLFERLRPGDELATGMGLAISRRCMDRLGGTIWIEPPSATGTTVSFTLPA